MVPNQTYNSIHQFIASVVGQVPKRNGASQVIRGADRVSEISAKEGASFRFTKNALHVT